MGTILLKIILTFAAILIVVLIKGALTGNTTGPTPLLLMIPLFAFVVGVWRYKPKRKSDSDKHDLKKD